MPDDFGPTSLSFSWCLFTRTGLLATTTEPDVEEWADATLRILDVGIASQWAAGDAYIIGDMAFGRFFDVTQVFSSRKVKVKTLMNYAWVCRAIPHSERDPEVSFTHHAVIAKLTSPRRKYWLDRVKREDLSVEDLEDLTAEERGSVQPRAPLADLTASYNRALEAYKRLPPAPEKGTIRRALRDLEGGIRAFRERLGTKRR